MKTQLHCRTKPNRVTVRRRSFGRDSRQRFGVRPRFAAETETVPVTVRGAPLGAGRPCEAFRPLDRTGTREDSPEGQFVDVGRGCRQATPALLLCLASRSDMADMELSSP